MFRRRPQPAPQVEPKPEPKGCDHRWSPTIDSITVRSGSASYSLSLRCSRCHMESDDPQAWTVGSVTLIDGSFTRKDLPSL